MIIFKVNVESILAFERERHTPVATNRNAPSAGATAFQPMQTITRQVHICGATSAVKHIHLSAQAVGKIMIARKKGRIINMSSQAGSVVLHGEAIYCMTKAAMVHMTRCLAVEWAPHGIRVNAVAPSLAMHPFLAKVTSDELLDELTSREAFNRAAEPWEVANVMVFLASDYSSYMTGEVVSVSSQRA